MCDLVTMVDSDDDDVVLGEVISLSETHFKSWIIFKKKDKWEF